MAYPQSYNSLINEWFNNPSKLAKSDPFLKIQIPDAGLLKQNYYDSMPEPIMGDLDKNLAVILNLNQSYTGSNNKKGYLPDEIVLGRKQMKNLVIPDYETYATPFPHLCSNPHHKAAADWWLPRQKWLKRMAGIYKACKASQQAFHTEGISNSTEDLPDLKPVALELCPYHSKKWSEANITNFTNDQKNWIDSNPFAAAQIAVKNSQLPFIISIGKPIYLAAKQLGFSQIIKWSSSKDSNLWPKNGKGNDTQRTFVVMEGTMQNGSTLKMLNIWSMFQKTPSEDFDGVIRQIFTNYL